MPLTQIMAFSKVISINYIGIVVLVPTTPLDNAYHGRSFHMENYYYDLIGKELIWA